MDCGFRQRSPACRPIRRKGEAMRAGRILVVLGMTPLLAVRAAADKEWE